MSFMSMLIAFLITFGVALVLAILILAVSAQGTRHRTRSGFFWDMLAPKNMKRGPYSYRSPGMRNFGLGEWLNAEIEQGKQVHRPRGSRARHTKSHGH